MHSGSEPTKTCCSCGRTFPFSRFSLGKGYRDGHRPHCKDCVNVQSREYYWKKHPEGRQRIRRGEQFSPGQWDRVLASGVLRCRVCQLEKPLSEYRKQSTHGKTYRARECRECLRPIEAAQRAARREHLKKLNKRRRCAKYGMTPEEFDRMVASQNGNCAICGNPLGKHCSIEHDHRTGRIRGVVHNYCNLVIGNAKETIAILAGAIWYLIEHRAGSGVRSNRQVDSDRDNNREATA